MARVASVIIALLATSVVAAPSASAVADCAVGQNPTVALTGYSSYLTNVDTNSPRVYVTASVTITCGIVAPTTSGYAVNQNVSTGFNHATTVSKYSDDGVTAYVSGSSTIPDAQKYGRFVSSALVIYYKRTVADATLYSATLSPNFTHFSRSLPYISNPYPPTQAVNEGDSVGLTGYLYTVLDKPEVASLQIKNGTEWDTVDTVNVNGEEFAFIYTPTKAVTYRYYYSQTDWAQARASNPAVLNFVPDVVVAKPPSAPPAFVSDTTQTTISLDWSPPADPNGTISAYRFGWESATGKPIPSYEDTYPTSGVVPDPLVFTKLNPETNYTVWVEAVNENGRSARTSIATETDASPIVTPPPPPPPPPAASVSVGTRSKAGKLYVNVNPNRGRAYWTFVVQKFTGGKWVNGKAYRTKGAGETRTINLKKGLYRVVVQPKFGYRGVVSSAVFLKK